MTRVSRICIAYQSLVIRTLQNILHPGDHFTIISIISCVSLICRQFKIELKNFNFYKVNGRGYEIYGILARSVILLNLVLNLTYFMTKGCNTEAWKTVMILYFICLLFQGVYGIHMEFKVGLDMIYLLNSCIRIEHNFINAGMKCTIQI